MHFAMLAVYAAYIIASDATHLITPILVYQRWLATALLLSIVALAWYLSRAPKKPANYYRLLMYLIILADITFATFNVYTQRGMAARAVMLYTLPIIISALLLSRVAILLTATICTASYALAAVKYFVDFFNEGYKAELYIEVAFYIACFYILSAVLGIIIRFKTAESELGL